MQECRPDFPDAEPVCLEEAGLAASVEIGRSAPVETGSYLAGAAWALLAISIWAGWFVSTRFSVSSNLTAYDLVALRFGVSAVILLPVAIRLRFGIGLLRWGTALALFAGSGVVYSVCVIVGLTFASAAGGAALTPGVMPMATALLSVLILKERLTQSQLGGLGLILGGVFLIAGVGLFHGTQGASAGHILFVTGAFLFAGYSIALRRSGLTGMEAAALVSVWSSAVYLPVYIISLHPRLLALPARRSCFRLSIRA